ncbi:MAG: flagellin lysine-N-methylase [Faecalimonas sp.]|nr:flagellin lysine-N-methylase [Faecalimonas sp.]
MKKALVLKPEYYTSFACKGSECRQTCCQEWAITLAKEEYRKIQNRIREREGFSEQKYFKKMPPEQRRNESYMKMLLDNEKKCLFLNKQKLCGLQCAFGADILPDTCIRFPRQIFENYSLTCATLSPACERTLEMLPVDRSLTFEMQDEDIEHAFPKRISIQQIYPKEIYPYATYFQDIYSMCILILQAQDISLEDRMILLGMGLKNVISLGEERKWEQIPGYIDTYLSKLSELEEVDTLLPQFSPNLSALFNNFLMADNEQEGSTSSYQKVIDRVKEILNISYETEGDVRQVSAQSFADYEEKKNCFANLMEDKPFFMENLLMSIFTYKNIPFSSELIGGIWENYIYLCWIYSSLKFVLTVCAEDIQSQRELIDYCVPLLRRWTHNGGLSKTFVKEFKKNSSNSLAHMAVLLKSC